MQLFFTKGKNGDGLLSKEVCNLPTSRSKAHPQKISQLRMNFHTSRKCCLTLWKCFHEILHSCQANQNPICHFLKNGGDRRRDKWVSFTKKILTWELKKRKNWVSLPKAAEKCYTFWHDGFTKLFGRRNTFTATLFPNKMAIDLVEKIIDTFQPTLIKNCHGKYWLLSRRRCLFFEISQ